MRPPAHSRALLEVIDLVKYFPVMGDFPRRVVGNIKAVDGISLGDSHSFGVALPFSGSDNASVGRPSKRGVALSSET